MNQRIPYIDNQTLIPANPQSSLASQLIPYILSIPASPLPSHTPQIEVKESKG